MRRFSAPLALCALVAVTMLGLRGASLTGQTATDSVSVELEVTTELSINVRAKPEKRIPGTGNDGTQLTLEFRNPGDTTSLQTVTVNTSSGGTKSDIVLTVSPGTYDVGAKGYSHLRKVKANVSISTGVTIDFTNNGTDPLLSGDVNAASGDNKVNGIDLTLIVGGLLGATVRYDLNRDGVVNGIDLTNAVTNLNEVGDA